MRRTIPLAIKTAAVFTILSLFTSACTLEDILAALARLCAMPTYVVNTAADTPGGLCSSGGCSLRQAVVTANACPGTQTISLPAGTYVLTHTGAGEDHARSGDLDLTDSVNIIGEGNPVIDGNRTDRIFDIMAGATVDITGLTIQHGDDVTDGGGIRNRGILRLHNVILQNNNAALSPGTPVSSGGAVLSEDDGGLTMEDSQVMGNNAFQGGGIAVLANGTTPPHAEITGSDISGNTGELGGGLWLDTGALVNLSNVGIHDNSAGSQDGDGIWNAANLNLDHVSINDNHGGINGGGIFNEPAGSIYAQNSLIEHNLARFGGAIYNRGNVHILQSAILNNEVDRGQGAGIFNTDSGANLSIENSTLSGNLGEGVVNTASALVLIRYSTIAFNAGVGLRTDSPSTVVNSILARNSPTDCAGGVVLERYNLESTNSCSFDETTDMVDTDPGLMPLVLDNGTYVHPLAAGSPAIDSADPTDCPGTDQRGAPRPGAPGSRCDRGAYEAASGSATAPLVYATPTVEATKAEIIVLASPTPTETPTPAASLAFNQPGLSVDHFYSGGAGCGPLDLELQVQVSQPNGVSSVVLFFHLKDKGSSASTAWNDGVAMEPQGGGVYTYDLASKTIPAFNSYPEAWFVYQFAAAGAGGQVVLRSPAYSNVTLTMCGKK